MAISMRLLRRLLTSRNDVLLKRILNRELRFRNETLNIIGKHLAKVDVQQRDEIYGE